MVSKYESKKVNPHKFNLLLRDKKVIRRIFVREAFKYVQLKVSGDKNDNKLTFEEHVEGLCKKASQKVIGNNFIFNEI